MIYAFDTYYKNGRAKTVGIGFENCQDDTFLWSASEYTEVAADYISGQFYKRELPCILSMLAGMSLKESGLLLVDGFVYLNDEQKLGLGGHLYYAIGQKNAVVGIGKTNFATLHHQKRAV